MCIYMYICVCVRIFVRVYLCVCVTDLYIPHNPEGAQGAEADIDPIKFPPCEAMFGAAHEEFVIFSHSNLHTHTHTHTHTHILTV